MFDEAMMIPVVGKTCIILTFLVLNSKIVLNKIMYTVSWVFQLYVFTLLKAHRLSELNFWFFKSCQYSMFYTNKMVLNKNQGLKKSVIMS
jgi:hypothetical protein